ncbi:MAG: hypothetical protein JWO05_1112 [Gemmatimonadetes bacterium]|nr:hypothetical protein [Gemmatimonadota bacterium]
MASGPPRVIRRRSRTGTPIARRTFTLHEDVVAAAESAVAAGAAANLSAFVEMAIEAKLREMERARLLDDYQEASNDPEFMDQLLSDTAEMGATAADGYRDE